MIYTAGVWLIFMGWTVIGFITSMASIPVQIAGWLALLASRLSTSTGSCARNHSSVSTGT